MSGNTNNNTQLSVSSNTSLQSISNSTFDASEENQEHRTIGSAAKTFFASAKRYIVALTNTKSREYNKLSKILVTAGIVLALVAAAFAIFAVFKFAIVPIAITAGVIGGIGLVMFIAKKAMQSFESKLVH